MANINYDSLLAYIEGLYDADGNLTVEDYNKIIIFILANGQLENSPRDLIQVRRGNAEDLPNLAQGELGFTLDEESLYIGGLEGNVRFQTYKTNSSVLTVAKRGGAFETINGAIEYAKEYCTPTNRVTIQISAGEYNEEIILMPNPGIDFVGIGKVEIKYPSVYPNSPIYTVGTGHFENLTFIRTNTTDGTNSYAFHFESANNPATGVVTFDNCIFESYTHAGAGIGLGQDCGVVFNNCELYSHANNPYGGLYFHNRMVNNTSNQFLRAVNCIIQSYANDIGMRIEDIAKMTGHPISTMSISFPNCQSNTPRMIYYDGTDTLNYIPPTNTNITIEADSVNTGIFGVDKNKYYQSVGAIEYVRSNDGIFTISFQNANRYNYTVQSAYNEAGHTITNDVTVENSQANFILLKSVNAMTLGATINVNLIATPI